MEATEDPGDALPPCKCPQCQDQGHTQAADQAHGEAMEATVLGLLAGVCVCPDGSLLRVYRDIGGEWERLWISGSSGRGKCYVCVGTGVAGACAANLVTHWELAAYGGWVVARAWPCYTNHDTRERLDGAR